MPTDMRRTTRPSKFYWPPSKKHGGDAVASRLQQDDGAAREATETADAEAQFARRDLQKKPHRQRLELSQLHPSAEKRATPTPQQQRHVGDDEEGRGENLVHASKKTQQMLRLRAV